MRKLLAIFTIFQLFPALLAADEFAPDGWKFFAIRTEIAPKPSIFFDKSGNYRLILNGNGNESEDGRWFKRIPVTAGKYVLFTARYKFANVVTPTRSIIASIVWLDEKGKQVEQAEFPLTIPTPDSEDYKRVTATYQVPAKATQAELQLRLRWAANGEVGWRDIELKETPAPSPRKVKVASINHRPRNSKSPQSNLEAFAKLIDEAGAEKSDIICLPEGITICGTRLTYADVAEPIPGPSTEALGKAAAKNKTYLIAGIYERDGKSIYNTAVLLGRDGKLLGKYRKVCLPREEIDGGITPGRDYPVFDTDFGRIGMMICWDISYPEVARELSARGAEMIFIPIWGGNETLAKARAIENQIYLVASGYDFRTAIYDKAGEVLAKSPDATRFFPALFLGILHFFILTHPSRAADSIPTEKLNNRDIALYRRSPTELWVYDTRPEAGVGSHSLDDADIKLIKAANIRLVRITMYWGAIENTETPGKYDPTQLRNWDNLVDRANRSGLELLVVVHSNPPGANFSNREASYKRFANFMSVVAKRYPKVRFWELWNEMDQAFTDLFGAQHPEIPLKERGKMYAEMLKLAYPAIKQSNPKAWVLTGGMTDWNDFPRGIYEAGGRDYFDFMNLHTYGVPVIYAFTARGLSLYNVMKEFHDEGRPIWNTEFGIDAGNVVNAWGFPHTRKDPKDDGPDFDAVHLSTWRDCIEDNATRRLYIKTLGYQFKAGNETSKDRMEKESKLPPGMKPDDYGFGLLRADGKTPRPTYNYLKDQNPNAAILKTPERQLDIEAYIPDGYTPIGHAFDYEWRKPIMIIKDVKVSTLEPTIIHLKPPAK